MNKLKWPGITVATMLVLIGTIVIAIWHDPDDFKLKDWQPSFAALIAIGAALSAFMAAMAKVESDRRLRAEELERIRMGVTLRLQTSLLLIRRYARNAITEIDDRLCKSRAGARIDGLGPPPGSEVDDAWDNLHLFPQPIAYKIANIRSNLLGLASAAKEQPGVVFIPDHVRELRKMFERIDVYAGEVLGWMFPDLADKTA